MYEIIEKLLILWADTINKIFLFEIQFDSNEYIPIGKIITAFIFISLVIYFILDAMGILDSEGE